VRSCAVTFGGVFHTNTNDNGLKSHPKVMQSIPFLIFVGLLSPFLLSHSFKINHNEMLSNRRNIISDDESKCFPLTLGSQDPFSRTFSMPNNIKDMRKQLKVGSVFVPVIGQRYVEYDSFSEKRSDMFKKGVYPGVEFEVIDLTESGEVTMKPIYPLIDSLEREWPVTVSLREIPWVLSRGSYNTITLVGSLSLALSYFTAAFLPSQAFTLSFINTRSMMNTIKPQDGVLVEKVSPIIKRTLHIPPQTQEVIFFKQPKAMDEYITKNNLPKVKHRDLIVKRVSKVVQTEDGNEVCVLGDNPRYSLDSRDFGCFEEEDIIGTPLIRLWPLNRIGLLTTQPSQQ
jgi:signal peptidase I